MAWNRFSIFTTSYKRINPFITHYDLKLIHIHSEWNRNLKKPTEETISGEQQKEWNGIENNSSEYKGNPSRKDSLHTLISYPFGWNYGNWEQCCSLFYYYKLLIDFHFKPFLEYPVHITYDNIPTDRHYLQRKFYKKMKNGWVFNTKYSFFLHHRPSAGSTFESCVYPVAL